MTSPPTPAVPPARPRTKVLQIAALLAVLALVVGLIASGALSGFSLEHTAQFVRSFGPWGFVVYLLLFSFVQPMGVTGHVFTIAAALIWPPWMAFTIALLGALGSALVNVAFVRAVAFDWVQARIPARLRKYERWLVERGLIGVIMFRGLTFTLHPAQLLIATVRVPLPRMIVGTLIGFSPHVAVDVLLGGQLLRWLATHLGFA